MKASLTEQQNYFSAFIKAAQYLAGLTAQQDIWSETGKVLVNFFGADVGALEERRANAEAAGHRWVFSERYSNRTDLKAETSEAIAEVLESGFLSARIIFTPDPLSIACFPITRENQIVAAMVVGHKMPEPLPMELLNVYLAVAGLVGTIGERLASERELRRHRRQLEQENAERRLAEEALRESRLRLDNIVANSPGAIYRCANDTEWTMEFLSAAITRITGYPADDFLNNRVRSFASIIHPDDRRGVAEAVAAGLERRDRYHMDYRLMAADGTLHWVHEQGQGVFAPDGRVLCLDGVIFDITDQRLAEESLRLNAERMEAMLQLNQMDSAPLEEMMNYAFKAALRLTRSKLGYFAFMNEDETVLNMQYWSHEAMAECKLSGIPKIYPVETIGLWGEAVRQRRPIITNDYAAPNPWKKGLPKGHVGLTRHMNLPVIVGGKIVLVAGVGNKEEEYTETDVQQLTLLMEGMWRLIERQRVEEALRRLNTELDRRVLDRTAQLEAANKELEAFAYSVSHDLRAPLRHIDGFIELLQKRIGPAMDDRSRNYMGTISDSAKRMGMLIDDLLAFSRMGRFEMSRRQVDLGGLVQEVIRELDSDGGERKISWHVGDLPVVTGDRAMLRIVLVNLISNALKFTRPREQAEIEIGCTPERKNETVVFVRDNGVGFDMNYADKLFVVFQRLHRVEEFEGNGIGLANVRRIISRHGGKTWAEGKVNQGATFFFSLP